MAMEKHPCLDNCPIQMPILAMFDYWRVSLQDRDYRRSSTSKASYLFVVVTTLWPSDFDQGLLQFRLRQLQTSQSHRSYLGSRGVSEVFEGTLKAWTSGYGLYTISLHWRCEPKMIKMWMFFPEICDEFLFVYVVLFHLYHKLSTIICARYICIAKHVHLFVVVDL